MTANSIDFISNYRIFCKERPLLLNTAFCGNFLII